MPTSKHQQQLVSATAPPWGEFGEFAFAPSLFQPWWFFAQQLHCQFCPSLGSQSETSPNYPLGLQGKCSKNGTGRVAELVATNSSSQDVPGQPRSHRPCQVPGVAECLGSQKSENGLAWK